MAGTHKGGIKAAKKNKELYGEDHYVKCGAKGGKACVSTKGFGSNRKLASIAGSKGGQISRRGKKNA